MRRGSPIQTRDIAGGDGVSSSSACASGTASCQVTSSTTRWPWMSGRSVPRERRRGERGRAVAASGESSAVSSSAKALVQARGEPASGAARRPSVSSNGQRAAQPRDLQRAGEVAGALVAGLQDVEQRGGDLVAAAPASSCRARPRRAGGPWPGRARAARSAAGGRRSGRARRRRGRPAARRGGRSRRGRSRSRAGGRGRARARGRSAARPARRGRAACRRWYGVAERAQLVLGASARARPRWRRRARSARARRGRRRGSRAPTPATSRARPAAGR